MFLRVRASEPYNPKAAKRAYTSQIVISYGKAKQTSNRHTLRLTFKFNHFTNMTPQVGTNPQIQDVLLSATSHTTIGPKPSNFLFLAQTRNHAASKQAHTPHTPIPAPAQTSSPCFLLLPLTNSSE